MYFKFQVDFTRKQDILSKSVKSTSWMNIREQNLNKDPKKSWTKTAKPST